MIAAGELSASEIDVLMNLGWRPSARIHGMLAVRRGEQIMCERYGSDIQREQTRKGGSDATRAETSHPASAERRARGIKTKRSRKGAGTFVASKGATEELR
jgi:hypothetical protein